MSNKDIVKIDVSGMTEAQFTRFKAEIEAMHSDPKWSTPVVLTHDGQPIPLSGKENKGG